MPMMIATTPRNRTVVVTLVMIIVGAILSIVAVVAGVVGVILGVTDDIISLCIILLFLFSLTIEILLRNEND